MTSYYCKKKPTQRKKKIKSKGRTITNVKNLIEFRKKNWKALSMFRRSVTLRIYSSKYYVSKPTFSFACFARKCITQYVSIKTYVYLVYVLHVTFMLKKQIHRTRKYKLQVRGNWSLMYLRTCMWRNFHTIYLVKRLNFQRVMHLANFLKIYFTFMCFVDFKEQMSCNDQQEYGILWGTTIAGITAEEPCPENQKGRQKATTVF